AISGVWVWRELQRRHPGTAPAGFPVVFTSALGHRPGRADDASSTAWLGENVYNLTQTPQVWLDHNAVEDQGELILAWDAVEALFPEGLLDDLFAAYASLVGRLAEDEAAWQTAGRPFPVPSPRPALLPDWPLTADLLQ